VPEPSDKPGERKAKLGAVQAAYDAAVAAGLPDDTVACIAKHLEHAKARLQATRPVARRHEAIRQVIACKAKKLEAINVEIDEAIKDRGELEEEIRKLHADLNVAELQFPAQRTDGTVGPAAMRQLVEVVPSLLSVMAQMVELARMGRRHKGRRRSECGPEPWRRWGDCHASAGPQGPVAGAARALADRVGLPPATVPPTRRPTDAASLPWRRHPGDDARGSRRRSHLRYRPAPRRLSRTRRSPRSEEQVDRQAHGRVQARGG